MNLHTPLTHIPFRDFNYTSSRTAGYLIQHNTVIILEIVNFELEVITFFLTPLNETLTFNCVKTMYYMSWIDTLLQHTYHSDLKHAWH